MNKNSQNKLFLAQNNLPLQVSNLFKRQGSKQVIGLQELTCLKQGDETQNLLINNNQSLKKKNNMYKLQLSKLVKCEQPLLNLEYSPKQEQNEIQRQNLQKDTKNKYFYQMSLLKGVNKQSGISKSHSVKTLAQNQIPSSLEIQKINSQKQQVKILSLEKLVDQISSVFSRNVKDKEESNNKQFYSPKTQNNSKIQTNFPSNQALQLNDFRNFLREQIFQQQSKQLQSQNSTKYLTDFFSSKQFKLQKNQKTQEQDQQSFSLQGKYENKSTKKFKQNQNNQNVFNQSCKQRSFTNNFTQTNYSNNYQEFDFYHQDQKHIHNNNNINNNNNNSKIVIIEENQQKEKNTKDINQDLPNKAYHNNKYAEKQERYVQNMNLLCNLNQIKNENSIQKINKKNSLSLNIKHIFLNERIQEKLVSPSQSVYSTYKKNKDELKYSNYKISQIIEKQKQDHLTQKQLSQYETITQYSFTENQQKSSVQNNLNEIKVKKIVNFSKNSYNQRFRNYKFKQENILLPFSDFNSPKIQKNIQQNKYDELEIKPWDYYSIQENIFDSYNNLVEINKQDMQTDIKNEQF
ncbi:hypothetical protein ABPG72_013013 [Tetrahymena utriculariae]